jgi:hypothetical protein
MPVSFHQEVAPLFAYHCNECHGGAGGLNLRTYKSALEGGNKGKLLIAGDPENSLLVHFIDGRRGAAHRMPLGRPPLTKEQIQTLRQWIAEGAKEDAKPTPQIHTRHEVKLPARLTVRVPVKAYITVTAVHPETNQILWTESAVPPTHWDLRPAPGWPLTVKIDLAVEYSTAKSEQIEFTAKPLEP